jgi:hypothetical protein
VNPIVAVAGEQLARMRGMNAAYHRRFFADIRFTTIVSLGLLAAGMAVDDRLFLAIPPVALLGACQTAFDASYLIFSRHYAARLERLIDAELGRDVLVAHRLEDAYLFPLDRPKVVTFTLRGFSWFGFMTALYTMAGIGVYTTGLVLSLPVIGSRIGAAAGTAYLLALGAATVGALGVGLWWFPGGEGEARLRRVLDDAFGADRDVAATA